MTTHETDHRQDEHEDEREEVEPGYFERDDAADEDDGDEIDTEGLSDPDADPDDEAEAFDEPIALGPTADDTTFEDDTTFGDDADESDPEVEPVIVELDETEVEVLDDPDADDEVIDDELTDDEAIDDELTDDDESVLLTETTPGSVLPPDGEFVEEEFVEEEIVVAPESVEQDPVAMLAPTAAGASVDPGTGTYQERWSAIQGTFVDEPHRAVEGAGALVAQMWHEFERSITDRRDALDNGWADDSATDDLRAAFKQYRELFQRLQSLLDDDTPT
jgi:hypothetical protein